MTKGIEYVFDYIAKILDREKVCQRCRDKSKCAECAFNTNDKNRKEVFETDKS